jgi:hypothetical protein
MLCDLPALADTFQDVIADTFVLQFVSFSNSNMIRPMNISDEIQALGYRRDAPIGFELEPVFRELTPDGFVDTVQGDFIVGEEDHVVHVSEIMPDMKNLLDPMVEEGKHE